MLRAGRLALRSAHAVRRVASAAAAPASPSLPFRGIEDAGYTTDMYWREHGPTFPVYRVMDEEGKVLKDGSAPSFSDDQLLSLYRNMRLLSVMDSILYDAQRQGRISFYMTSFGEEGVHFGSASAFTPDDVIFMQYREVGVLLHRG